MAAGTNRGPLGVVENAMRDATGQPLALAKSSMNVARAVTASTLTAL
jgi:hypothetical protein